MSQHWENWDRKIVGSLLTSRSSKWETQSEKNKTHVIWVISPEVDVRFSHTLENMCMHINTHNNSFTHKHALTETDYTNKYSYQELLFLLSDCQSSLFLLREHRQEPLYLDLEHSMYRAWHKFCCLGVYGSMLKQPELMMISSKSILSSAEKSQ